LTIVKVIFFAINRLGVESAFYLLVIPLIVAIFLKAAIDVDTNYDPGWYHLPFAGRIWGILPREIFVGDEKWFEPRFDGFPLLAHFFQGFFWRITGRIQSTNLVGFFSILGYFYFLRTYFKVPFYLSAIAILAIPLVFTNTITSFVDLFGNVGTSILVMMSYSFYKNKHFPKLRELLIAFIGAAIAVNTKTQLQPLIFFCLVFTLSRLGWLYWQKKTAIKQAVKSFLLTLLALFIIFASPIKNTVLYSNPLYPIKVEIAGIVLPYKLSPEAYEEGNRQLNWVSSVLEINAPYFWSPDQWSNYPERSRRGGFFGAYVIFNLLLLGGLFLQELIQNRILPKQEKSREAKFALLTAMVMSIVPLNFPQSHELRYFMYWMITLVSLNLYLVSRPRNREIIGRWLQPKYMALIYTIFLAIVLTKVGVFVAKPSFNTLDKYVALGVKSSLIEQIEPDEKVCLISKHMGEAVQAAPMAALKYAFLYSSYFHPEINHDYSIQAAFDAKACGDIRMIPSDFNQ